MNLLLLLIYLAIIESQMLSITGISLPVIPLILYQNIIIYFMSPI